MPVVRVMRDLLGCFRMRGSRTADCVNKLRGGRPLTGLSPLFAGER
jgi:hypothetical protein